VSIGETLTAARLAAGMTTADVAEKTRIRRTLIEAIEADDYRLCGGDVYARGHIGTIARTVGTDPAPLLADFDRSHGHDNAPSATEVFESETGTTRERRNGPNWSAAMAAALVVIVLLAGWQLSRGGGKDPGTTATGTSSTATSSTLTGSTAGTPSSHSPSVSHSPSTKPSNSDLAQVPGAKGVVVKVAAVDGNCWVQAKAGTHVVYEGTLTAGTSKTFSDAKQVKLILGNSGAVRLNVNGRNLGSPAASGQISRLTFGPGDPTQAG
jgi:cytoskeleton protein RodZ